MRRETLRRNTVETTWFSLACWNWSKCATTDLGRPRLFLPLIPFWQLFLLPNHKSLPELESPSVRLTIHLQKQSYVSFEGCCEKDKHEWHVSLTEWCHQAGNQSWESGGWLCLHLGLPMQGIRTWEMEVCIHTPHNLTNLSTTAMLYSRPFVLNPTFNNFTDQIKQGFPQLQINRAPLLVECLWNLNEYIGPKSSLTFHRGEGRDREPEEAFTALCPLDTVHNPIPPE